VLERCYALRAIEKKLGEPLTPVPTAHELGISDHDFHRLVAEHGDLRDDEVEAARERYERTGRPEDLRALEEAEARAHEHRRHLEHVDAVAAAHGRHGEVDSTSTLRSHQERHDEALDAVKRAQADVAANPHDRAAHERLAAAQHHLHTISREHEKDHQGAHTSPRPLHSARAEPDAQPHAELAYRYLSAVNDPDARPEDVKQAQRDLHLSSVHRVHAARDKVEVAQDELDAAEHARPRDPRRVESAKHAVNDAHQHLKQMEDDERRARDGLGPSPSSSCSMELSWHSCASSP